MENWIGIFIWIVLGGLVGLGMRALVKRPEETRGHVGILIVLGAFGALIGGMLGVGLFHLYDPAALSVGGMAGALLLAGVMAFVYRWGIRGLI